MSSPFCSNSGSDRIGALDFQASPANYAAREGSEVSLDELLNAAALVEKGVPLTAELDRALLHGSSIGGARPKATIGSGNKKLVDAQNDLGASPKYIVRWPQERASQIALCLKAAPLFLMSNAEAILLATKQVKTIKQRWLAICDEAKLSKVDRNFLWRRQFLNPYAFLEAPQVVTKLID